MQKRKHFISTVSLLLVSLILLCCFPLTTSASEKSRVTDIQIDPITIIEGTFGDYDSNDGYFKYYPEDLLNYTVTFNDGKTYSSQGYAFDYDGKWYWFETETDQKASNRWTVGNTYTMTVSLQGVSVEVPVTITESPVDRIEVEPVSVIEHTNGYWESDFNNESGKYEPSFYYYDYSEYTSGTIYFKDGTSTVFSGETDCEFEYNGETYWVLVTDDQSLTNPWAAGNEYNVKFEAMGVSANMPVTIEESPIKSIEIAPIHLIEYTNGYWTTEDEEEYYAYQTGNLFSCTVTFENGDVVENYSRTITYKDEIYDIEITDNQSASNQWTAGNTYKMTVEIMGFVTQAEVYIDYSPIQSIELKPVSLYEYSEGFWASSYDSDNNAVMYYQYEPMNRMEYKITYKDGTTVCGTGYDVSYEDYFIYFDCSDPQSINNQWTAGNKYEMEVSLTGITATLEVEILESPIVGIEIEPIEITENTKGHITCDFDEETYEQSDEYFYYLPEECMNYTITLEDGSTIRGCGYSFDFCDYTYFLDIETNQSYNNQWTAGNTYKCTVSFMDIKTEVEVTITESPVESIVFEPISIAQGTCGEYACHYNPETHEWDLCYFTYAPEEMLKYTVTFKDGSECEYIGNGFEHNGNWYEFEVATYQNYYNQWTVGNTYTITVDIMGKSYDVDVTITE